MFQQAKYANLSAFPFWNVTDLNMLHHKDKKFLHLCMHKQEFVAKEAILPHK